MRILEERLSAQDEGRKYSSSAGSKTRRDTCRSQDSHAIKQSRLHTKENRHDHGDKNAPGTEQKERRTLAGDKRLKGHRLLETYERSSSRHTSSHGSSKTHYGSRHGTDKHERNTGKSAREKVSKEENKDKRRGHKR